MSSAPSKVQTRSLCLVAGYSRSFVENSTLSAASVPNDVLCIISQYFLAGYPYLICNGNHEHPGIYVLDIVGGTRRRLSISDIASKTTKDFILMQSHQFYATCLISNIAIPSSWRWLHKECADTEELRNGDVSMIFSFGGRDAMYIPQASTQLVIYSNSTHSRAYSVDLPQLPHPISGNSVIYNNCVDDNIYSFGGSGEDWNRSSKIQCLNLKTLEWAPMKSHMSVPKVYASLCNHRNGIFVLGGYSGSIDDSMDFFDVEMDTSTPCSDMLHPASSASVLRVDDELFVCGGLKADNAHQNLIQCYNTVKNTWTLFPAVPSRNTKVSCIFNHVVQPHIVYVYEAPSQNKMQGNYIEWIDLRDIKSGFKPLHEKDNQELFNVSQLRSEQKVLVSCNECNLN